MSEKFLGVLLMCYLFLNTSAVYGQGFNNNWYFGYNAGITFSTNPPTALTGGQLSTFEGCVSISNSAGNLMFYSDGIKVWNKNHIVMTNGTGLNGDPSAAQSGIVLPKPGSGTLFYLITVGISGKEGLKYSTIDMSLAGGLGDVISKNNVINPNLIEKVTAIKHANGIYYWIIGHERNSARYHAYLVDCGGVSTTPVISDLTALGGIPSDEWGYITASSDAKKVAFAASYNGIELADFDNATGTFSNPKQLGKLKNGGREGGHYGVAFSPNNKVLYATSIENWGLWQWDLTASNISDSKQFIGDLAGSSKKRPDYRGGALMKGPDNKIYATQYGQEYLSVINNPNTVGTGCGLTANAIHLGTGRTCGLGLPTNVQPFIEPPVITVNPTNFCEGSAATFTYNGFDVSALDSINWVFDDPLSGPNNRSNSLTATHTFNAGGTYNVKFIRFLNCFTDTVVKVLTIDKKPVVPTGITFTPNANLCPGITITLTANGGINPGSSKYVWGTTVNGNDLGTTTTNTLQINPEVTTDYYVSVSNNGTCPGGFLSTPASVIMPVKGNQLSANGESATCYVSGNSLIHFYHPTTKNYIGAVNPKGRSGILTITSYVDPLSDAGIMNSCTMPNNLTLQTAYMGRRFTVKSTGAISGAGNLEVYFPFNQNEADKLFLASTSNVNPNDDVTAIGGLYATKFSGDGGLYEEGSPTNNCGNGVSTVLGQTRSDALTTLGISPAIQGTNYFASFGVSSFSEFFLHGKNNMSPLPIELLSFSVSCAENTWRDIHWTTATERDVAYFTILSSVDGKTWEEEKQIAAVGNSSVKQHYSISTRGRTNTTYYKLVSTDMDGTSTDYLPVTSMCESKYSWSVFPNPASSTTSILINSETDGISNIYVYDTNGKLVLGSNTYLSTGANLISLDLSALSKGLYILKLEHENEYKPIKLVVE